MRRLREREPGREEDGSCFLGFCRSRDRDDGLLGEAEFGWLIGWSGLLKSFVSAVSFMGVDSFILGHEEWKS